MVYELFEFKLKLLNNYCSIPIHENVTNFILIKM